MEVLRANSRKRSLSGPRGAIKDASTTTAPGTDPGSGIPDPDPKTTTKERGELLSYLI
jgi:hypothetical protein